MGLDHGDIQDPNVIICMKCIDIMKSQPLHHCDFSKGINRSCASCASAKIGCNSVPVAARDKMMELAREAAQISNLPDEDRKDQLLKVRTLAMSFCDDFAEVMTTPRTARRSTGERGGRRTGRKQTSHPAASPAATAAAGEDHHQPRHSRLPSRLNHVNINEDGEESRSQTGEVSPRDTTFPARDLFGAATLLRSTVESSAWLETHFKRVHQANDWQIRDSTRILEVLEGMDATMKEILSLYKEDLALRKQQTASAGLGMTVGGAEMTMPLRRAPCPGEKRGREDEEEKNGDQMAWKKAKTDEETEEGAVQQLADKTGDAGDGAEAKQQTGPYDGSIMVVDKE